MSSPHRFRLWSLAPVLLAVVFTGPVGCTDASGDTPRAGSTGGSPSSAGRLTDAHDDQGHRFREVPEKGAPQVDIVLRPDAEDGWDLTLSVHHFRFTPAPDRGRPAAAVRGQAQLYLDGRRIALLHGTGYHLPSKLLSRGTNEVTARLYADDRTVWAVHGKPVESTAPLTASHATPDQAAGPGGDGTDTATTAGAGGAAAPGGAAAGPRGTAHASGGTTHGNEGSLS